MLLYFVFPQAATVVPMLYQLYIKVQLTIQACMGSPSSDDKIARLFTPALYERKKNLERSGAEQIDTL